MVHGNPEMTPIEILHQIESAISFLNRHGYLITIDRESENILKVLELMEDRGLITSTPTRRYDTRWEIVK